MPYVVKNWYFQCFLHGKKGPIVKGPFSQRALDTKFILDPMYFRPRNRLEVVSERFDKYLRRKRHYNVKKAPMGPSFAENENIINKTWIFMPEMNSAPLKTPRLTPHMPNSVTIWCFYDILQGKKRPNFKGPFLQKGSLFDFNFLTKS